MNVASEPQLPPGFGRLEDLVSTWALPSEAARNQRRLNSSMEEIHSFYDAVLGEMDALVSHLAGFRLSELPQPERRLLYLALALMEVAPAVEIYRQPDVPDAIDAARLIILSPA